jgi:hypothetical protein
MRRPDLVGLGTLPIVLALIACSLSVYSAGHRVAAAIDRDAAALGRAAMKCGAK